MNEPVLSAAGDGFDVIGDVHGEADKLERLLARMGYVDDGCTDRKSVV